MNYENLEVWKLSFKLAVKVHECFKACKDFGLKDQIYRCSVSVPSNIAEGEERETTKESVRFLYIAKGSCGELITQLMLAKEFKYLTPQEADSLIAKAKQISRMLAGLIKYRSGSVREDKNRY
ncbi:four helix bundle protein [Vibrio breoganii]|uniref:Four helix bundle protein n=1 Tax=Vibrio breoganii TaxID=553239 RepID=A0ABX1UDK6_9VIBR|nr:four helix bundle protein [Vibrio breoganii]NMO74813.1 four helix bundle protein [Vibrio breoganii]NMR71464.1 four helix bundle protein [Vibrio breoganii]PMG05097.1 four helix bundle protein [Vibrio breoganii]PMH15401.1 four helix bundle protein [Vibrio breoganii]PMI16116.1 four helix bundle protein [Vibrio breoganii]